MVGPRAPCIPYGGLCGIRGLCGGRRRRGRGFRPVLQFALGTPRCVSTMSCTLAMIASDCCAHHWPAVSKGTDTRDKTSLTRTSTRRLRPARCGQGRQSAGHRCWRTSPASWVRSCFVQTLSRGAGSDHCNLTGQVKPLSITGTVGGKATAEDEMQWAAVGWCARASGAQYGMTYLPAHGWPRARAVDSERTRTFTRVGL